MKLAKYKRYLLLAITNNGGIEHWRVNYAALEQRKAIWRAYDQIIDPAIFAYPIGLIELGPIHSAASRLPLRQKKMHENPAIVRSRRVPMG